jgi:hypothetical protein
MKVPHNVALQGVDRKKTPGEREERARARERKRVY